MRSLHALRRYFISEPMSILLHFTFAEFILLPHWLFGLTLGEGLWIGILSGAALHTILLSVITCCTNLKKQAATPRERLRALTARRKTTLNSGTSQMKTRSGERRRLS
ncbi:hypothetical protein RND71_008563 [Anisodus tanguticus]|uniref:Uncharacterized protein n=1 Tax=Anisodus tanguticus TaxID=243964 RepID=A0AAE1VTW4_9SOLA|nr:hypothetical protein RND71_008563 [Anisodus tanguticus]